jgi:hypothetical protein
MSKGGTIRSRLSEMGIVKGRPPSMVTEGTRLPLLVSYAYLRGCNPVDRAYILNEAKADGIDVLLDCGAFSAANSGHEITCQEYIDFLLKYKDAFFAYIALDKIKDPVETQRNLEAMFEAGLRPGPVHVLGDDGKKMDELFERSDLVFLGGFKRPGRGPAGRDYIAQKMRWAKGRHVHWLGYSNKSVVPAFTPYSVDCSTWTGAQRFGKCDVYLGTGHWWYQSRRDRHKPVPLRALKVLQGLGYSETDWKLEGNWRRQGGSFMTMEISTSSWIRYVMELRRDFGTRMFLACALAGSELDCIVRHWRILRDEWSQSE